MNILVVEDESSISEPLCDALIREGYGARVAASLQEARAEIAETMPDLILLDVWLPGIDGLETLQKIREIDNAPEVIMISGHGTIETAVRATKLGAYDFL